MPVNGSAQRFVLTEILRATMKRPIFLYSDLKTNINEISESRLVVIG